ncbi:MAG: polymerase delta prime subunit [Myxococcaceae bacterium]|nr:polymerase delta prime subunit [Myxococcaceae bacterium]
MTSASPPPRAQARRLVTVQAAWYPACAMLLSQLRGQNTAVKTLERALSKGQLPNAYLFEGPSGVGKHQAALALAQARLCTVHAGKGCGSCIVCTRILASNHPDARQFKPRDEGKRNIQVETLRNEILPLTQYAPFEGAHAFMIFPEADVSFPAQHPEAANALLKTLEEPRAGVTFVLLSDRPQQLLQTIRSRCQRVRFGPLPPLVVEHVLEEHGVAEALRGPAIALAEGSADRALLLAKDGTAKDLLDRALRIDRTLALRDTGRLIELSEELAKSDDLPLVLGTLAAVYRDVAVQGLGLGADKLRFQSERAQIQERAQELRPQHAAARVSRLAELPELLAKNANPQIALDNLLVQLSQLR